MTGATGLRFTAICRCGKSAIALDGAPILTAACCCKDCQTAGRQFEAEGGLTVLRADGGTGYCLYRKDRARVARGGEHLQERRLKPTSPTRRLVAACCQTPMVLDFTKGHWLTLCRDRIPDAPPLEAVIMTKDAPAGAKFEDGVPAYPRQPARLVFRLLAAWAAMGFRRPKFG